MLLDPFIALLLRSVTALFSLNIWYLFSESCCNLVMSISLLLSTLSIAVCQFLKLSNFSRELSNDVILKDSCVSSINYAKSTSMRVQRDLSCTSLALHI